MSRIFVLGLLMSLGAWAESELPTAKAFSQTVKGWESVYDQCPELQKTLDEALQSTTIELYEKELKKREDKVLIREVIGRASEKTKLRINTRYWKKNREAEQGKLLLYGLLLTKAPTHESTERSESRAYGLTEVLLKKTSPEPEDRKAREQAILAFIAGDSASQWAKFATLLAKKNEERRKEDKGPLSEEDLQKLVDGCRQRYESLAIRNWSAQLADPAPKAPHVIPPEGWERLKNSSLNNRTLGTLALAILADEEEVPAALTLVISLDEFEQERSRSQWLFPFR